ncbi:MAG: hypothetical protein ACJAS1_002492 [Oleiphilaceae bacterium]|jgi:hypothetical protein
MFLGFNFDPDTAVEHLREFFDSGEDVELEYIETQRASISGMLKHPHLLTDHQKESLETVEKMLYDYLCKNGAVSSPVLLDEAIGGDLLHIPFNGQMN